VGVVEGDFDIFNIPKLSEEEQAQYQEGGVEINSA